MLYPDDRSHNLEDELILQGVRYLQARLPVSPKVGIILGSGLGRYAELSPALFVEDYADIPGFTPCSVSGHRGRLVLCARQGTPVALLQGRIHRYEGYSLHTVTRPVRILAALGVTTLLITCAAGSVTGMPPGSFMVVTDHLNLMGDNPLVGGMLQRDLQERFIELSDAYDARLITLAKEIARKKQMPLFEGVLAGVPGPSYETRAEAEMLKRLGARAVTMSTIPEVIMARAHKMSVLVLALITNESGQSAVGSLSHDAVVASSESKAKGVEQILGRSVKRGCNRFAITPTIKKIAKAE